MQHRQSRILAAQQTAFPREGFRTISYSRRGVELATRSKEPIAHHADLARLMDA